MKTVLFHGYPGSGKDTQVDLLVNKYEFEGIGAGEMIRSMYKQGDIEAFKANQYLEKGQLVPNDLIYSMLNKWVERFDEKKDWAFVSAVRDIGQIPLFDDLLKRKKRTLDYFIHFTLPDEVAVERLSLRRICPYCDTTYHAISKPENVKGYCDRCGTKLVQREDDLPERITVRQKEYYKAISPILEAYKQRGILIEIDATPSIEEIHNQVVQKLNLL